MIWLFVANDIICWNWLPGLLGCHILVCGRLWEKWHRFCLHCDFHFKHLNISFSENKLILYLNSSCQDCSVQKNRKKVAWFFVNWYSRISHWWKKVVDDKTLTTFCLICQQPLIQRNCSMLCHKKWLAPSTTLPPKLARDTWRTVYMNTSRCQRFISNCFEKVFLARSRPNSHSNYKLTLFIAIYIHLFIHNYFFSCLGSWQMKQYIFEEYFHQWLYVLNAKGTRATSNSRYFPASAYILK